MEKSINFCVQAAEASTEFERNNSELKRSYLVKNIELYNSIVASINGNYGSFGTGYPFQALGENLTGNLPVIEEQIRYNNELIGAVINSRYTTWNCATCLSHRYDSMPDLKQICKPCPNMDPELKPRKILTRMPDIDMWMVCDKNRLAESKDVLTTLLTAHHMHPSDIEPIESIEGINEIANQLSLGIMPERMLPLDAHIIDYQTFYSLIEEVPYALKQANKDGCVPYLPIHPLSYRKVWQYDDTAYNFIYDFLSSLTEFNFEGNLKEVLVETRRLIAKSYTFEQIYDYVIQSGPASTARRYETPQMKKRLRERVDTWKRC